MSMTAERLAGRGGVSMRQVLIGLAPVTVLCLILLFNSEILISEPERGPAPEYYPSVSIVFVSTTSEERDVTVEGIVDAERRVALRADTESKVLAVGVNPGDRVSRGQKLCLLEDTSTGEQKVLFNSIDGVVSSVNGAKGTVLGKGSPCVTIIDDSTLVAMSALPPRHADIIAAGDTARVMVGGVETPSAVRIVYPEESPRDLTNRTFEVALPENTDKRVGDEADIKITTEQVMPTLIPFRALMLHPSKGMIARVVDGSGPAGELKTVPVTLVAAASGGFYVEGLPTEARLVVRGSESMPVEDGETVRIRRVE
ncbi:HlyD family efflux transporter periplasmic adaptor subunit [Parvularcula lutaonensis]|uniref:HlyD family efflux transporter periplasmic adaptor subunit n=1 Tax=Parvularcula lutaonensis TaxID=491923 RepID=A0ABV7MHL1_9PROT|nr:HlyD family efflux transporter periplasmic adaptor subunit [Parvularcula lutaonensis]GGY54621.1 hypothetical protein GCM10007148_25380 [Parvularcula lutaonensis]